MKNTINVLVKEPGKGIEERDIPNTLEALQSLVMGLIETVTLSGDLLLIVNEEGLINDMRFNCRIYGYPFFGPIVFASVDGEEFGDCKYSPEQLRKRLFEDNYYAKGDRA